MTDRLSVVMATYNGEAYIKQQLNSILSQSIPPDEIVIVDDCSSDSTRKILKQYAEKEKNIHIIFNEKNIGINKNFEKAIKNSTGGIVFIADQDDIWFNEKIEKTLDAFNRNSDASLLYSDASVINKKGETISDSELDFFNIIPVHENPLIPLLFKNCISGHNMAFRRDIIQSAFPFPEGTIYDQWLALFFSSKGKIGYIDSKLVKHRIHDKNNQNAKKSQLNKQRKPILRKLKKTDKRRKDKIELLNRVLSISTDRNNIFFINEMLKFYRNYNTTFINSSYRRFLYNYRDIIFKSTRYNDKQITSHINKHSRGRLFYLLNPF